MESKKIKDIIFSAAKEAGLEEYEIYRTSDSSISTETLRDEISSFAYGVSGGVCFRCIKDGKIGMASTELLAEEELRSLVLRAASNAENIESDDAAVIFAGSDEYKKTNMPEFIMPDAAKIKSSALFLQRKAYAESDKIVDGTQSAAFAGTTELYLANSHGLELKNSFGTVGAYLQAVVKVGEENEEGFDFSGSLEESELCDVCARTVDMALSRIGAGEVESGKYDVIFSAKQARALLATFSDVFSGRNAQLGLSLLAGKEGEKVASECITVVDDPLRAGARAQTSFDGEGVATYTKTVIEGGVLRTLLYDIASASRAGVASTGNGQRASYASPVTVSPYNFYIKGGEKSRDELISCVADGIYITELKGLHAGANDVTGDFSIESEGVRIRDGKLCEPVKSFTIAGNFFELLRSVEDISSEVSFGLCSGYTNFGAPDVYIKQMSVAGK